MPREQLRLQIDVPLIITLDPVGPEGRETGKGDYQYFVNGDSAVLWLDASAREALLRSGARAGDSVQLVKSLAGKKQTFSVQRVGEQQSMFAQPYAQPAAPPPARPQPASDDSSSSGGMRSVAKIFPQAAAAAASSSRDLALEDAAAAYLEMAARAHVRAWAAVQVDGLDGMAAPTWANVTTLALTLLLQRPQR